LKQRRTLTRLHTLRRWELLKSPADVWQTLLLSAERTDAALAGLTVNVMTIVANAAKTRDFMGSAPRGATAKGRVPGETRLTPKSGQVPDHGGSADNPTRLDKSRDPPYEGDMKELVRANDPVLLSAVGALLDGAKIPHVVLDQNMSVLEGSVGIIARRVLVPDEHERTARNLLTDAGLGHELRHDDGR
jgi:hypothetical protein